MHRSSLQLRGQVFPVTGFISGKRQVFLALAGPSYPTGSITLGRNCSSFRKYHGGMSQVLQLLPYPGFQSTVSEWGASRIPVMKQVLRSQTSSPSLMVPCGTGCAQVEAHAQCYAVFFGLDSFHLSAAAWAHWLREADGAAVVNWLEGKRPSAGTLYKHKQRECIHAPVPHRGAWKHNVNQVQRAKVRGAEGRLVGARETYAHFISFLVHINGDTETKVTSAKGVKLVVWAGCKTINSCPLPSSQHLLGPAWPPKWNGFTNTSYLTLRESEHFQSSEHCTGFTQTET